MPLHPAVVYTGVSPSCLSSPSPSIDQVTYKRSKATSLGLRIPLDAATNRAELEARDQKRQRLENEAPEGSVDKRVGCGGDGATVVTALGE